MQHLPNISEWNCYHYDGKLYSYDITVGELKYMITPCNNGYSLKVFIGINQKPSNVQTFGRFSYGHHSISVQKTPAMACKKAKEHFLEYQNAK